MTDLALPEDLTKLFDLDLPAKRVSRIFKFYSQVSKHKLDYLSNENRLA
jgi:hypothetical protein